MKEHPIIFSSEMVRAILDGRKTMTRRIVKKHPLIEAGFTIDFINDPGNAGLCPYGQSGDRLWVKEAWKFGLGKNGAEIFYKTYPVGQGGGFIPGPWKPSVFMPRWASRITLEITDVRVAKLHDMNFYDWVADFCPSSLEKERALEKFIGMKNMTEIAKKLWDSLNVKRGFGWDMNPWVWVISFKRIEQGGKPCEE